MLSDYLRSMAEWRRRQDKQYPNDRRNDKSAAALESLADFVDGPDVSKEALERLRPHQPDAETLGGDRARRAVERYGYLNIIIEDHHRAFLDELGALAELDAYEIALGNGEDPTGTLKDFELDAAKEGLALPIRYFEVRKDASDDELRESLDRHREIVTEREEAERAAAEAERAAAEEAATKQAADAEAGGEEPEPAAPDAGEAEPAAPDADEAETDEPETGQAEKDN